MLDIFSDFLSFCLQFFPFPFLPSSFLLTDSSDSNDEPQIIDETKENDLLYSGLCRQCFDSTTCFNNIINPVMASLPPELINILWNASPAPVEKAITDLSVISQHGDDSNTTALVLTATTAIIIMTLVILRAYVRRGRSQNPPEDKTSNQENPEDEAGESLGELRADIEMVRRDLGSLISQQRGLNERIKNMEDLERKNQTDISQSNKEKLDQIRSELVQVYNDHSRTLKDNEGKKEKKLESIEEKLMRFEKHIVLMTDFKNELNEIITKSAVLTDELTKVSSENADLRVKIEKINETCQKHENIMSTIIENQIDLKENLKIIKEEIESLKSAKNVNLQEKATNGDVVRRISKELEHAPVRNFSVEEKVNPVSVENFAPESSDSVGELRKGDRIFICREK